MICEIFKYMIIFGLLLSSCESNNRGCNEIKSEQGMLFAVSEDEALSSLLGLMNGLHGKTRSLNGDSFDVQPLYGNLKITGEHQWVACELYRTVNRT